MSGNKIIKNADLFKLNDGDRFKVINGNWIGTIRVVDGKHFVDNDEHMFELKDDYNHTLDIVIIEDENTYYNTVGNIIPDADLLKLNDGTVFDIVGGDAQGVVSVLNGIHYVDIGGEMLEITDEFNKNVTIQILHGGTSKCTRMSFA